MTGAKFDIEKFDGTGDFGLWRIKMRALLIQYGCEAALEVLPADMEAEAKAELNKKAHSAVILCLGNKVLREVTGETTAAGVWTKLETLYMTKSKKESIHFYIRWKINPVLMEKGIVLKHITAALSSGSARFEQKHARNVIRMQPEIDIVEETLEKEGITVKMQSANQVELNSILEEKDNLAQFDIKTRHISESGLQCGKSKVFLPRTFLGEKSQQDTKETLVQIKVIRQLTSFAAAEEEDTQ
ncbi:hypothetical protein Tco_1564229 [Tanacetum coccineum]